MLNTQKCVHMYSIKCVNLTANKKSQSWSCDAKSYLGFVQELSSQDLEKRLSPGLGLDIKYWSCEKSLTSLLVAFERKFYNPAANVARCIHHVNMHTMILPILTVLQMSNYHHSLTHSLLHIIDRLTAPFNSDRWQFPIQHRQSPESFSSCRTHV